MIMDSLMSILLMYNKFYLKFVSDDTELAY